VVDRPRNFVVSQHFVGPDRRRKHLPPDDKTEKRGRRVPLIKKPPQVPAKSESPLLLMPEYELRRALGLTGPLSEVITPSVIAAAQAEIDLRQDDAMQWIRQDLEAIQDSFANLRKSPSPQAAEQMQMTTLSLKSRAGIFGYQVASDIAHLLYRFVFKEYDAKRPADNQIVQQSIEALKVIIGQNIKLPNHMTDELVEELRRALKTE
jgi:flagellar biosynthesis/type III secretory pathway protein FliH